MLGQTNLEEDVLSISSFENNDISSETSSCKENSENSLLNNDIGDKEYLQSDNVQKLTKHARSFSDVSDIATVTKNKSERSPSKFDLEIHKNSNMKQNHQSITKEYEEPKNEEKINIEEEYSKLKTGNFTLAVDIIEAGNL